MGFPDDVKYSKEHEWIKIESSGMVTVGVTDYAQEQLGEIVFVELPKEGEEFEKDDSLGVLESVKSVSDIYSPISGQVVEVNEPLIESPELVNEDSYGEGWMIRLKVKDKDELKGLMTAKEYEEFIKEETE